VSEEHSAELDIGPIFWRTAPGPAGTPPALYVHGAPTNSDIWEPFLAAGGGIAPDLPGFGRSTKRGDLDFTIPGYTAFLERFLDHVGIDRVRLVVQDWGAVALGFAQAHPDRIDRLVVINAVPLLPGYRWHRVARVWRTRGLGELFMGATTRAGFRLLSRESNATPGPLPEDFVDAVYRHFDEGTQRAMLRLYRWADPDVLAQAGARLGTIVAPALVLWGEEDPYIPVAFADAYGAALPNATVERLSGAGHWPWLDRPDVVTKVVDFLR